MGETVQVRSLNLQTRSKEIRERKLSQKVSSPTPAAGQGILPCFHYDSCRLLYSQGLPEFIVFNFVQIVIYFHLPYTTLQEERQS